jgi:hypothetical protein
VIDTNVVRLAVEYLDECKFKGAPATLVGMHWRIDSANKTLPLTDEVNEAIKQRPHLRIQRINGLVVFVPEGKDRTVTGEEMKLADKKYRKEFWAAVKKAK